MVAKTTRAQPKSAVYIIKSLNLHDNTFDDCT